MSAQDLIVIATVVDNEGAYLIPALIFSLVATVVPIGFGLEAGRVRATATKPAGGRCPRQ